MWDIVRVCLNNDILCTFFKIGNKNTQSRQHRVRREIW